MKTLFLSGTGAVSPVSVQLLEEEDVVRKLTWDVDAEGMLIVIKCGGKVVMGLSLWEVIESFPRKCVERVVANIERTPWIKNWHPKS